MTSSSSFNSSRRRFLDRKAEREIRIHCSDWPQNEKFGLGPVYCFHGPGRSSSPRADFRGQNPSSRTSGFSVFSVLVYKTIFTGFKMIHIEAKSIHIWLRYDQKWEILILACPLECGCSNLLSNCLLNTRILERNKRAVDVFHELHFHVLSELPMKQ